MKLLLNNKIDTNKIMLQQHRSSSSYCNMNRIDTISIMLTTTIIVMITLLKNNMMVENVNAFTTSNNCCNNKQQQQQQQRQRKWFQNQHFNSVGRIPSSLQYSIVTAPTRHHQQKILKRKMIHKHSNRFQSQHKKQSKDVHHQFDSSIIGTSISSTSTALSASTTAAILGMVVTTTPAAAVVMSAISGGIMSGGLHAIAGPDHIAALLPRCIGQQWYRAIRVGTIWGIGHGISATILGCIAFVIKRITIDLTASTASAASMTSVNPLSLFLKACFQFLASKGSNVMEIAVGVSLIVIGSMGMKEARDFTFDYNENKSDHNHDNDVKRTSPVELHNLSAAVNVAHVEETEISSATTSTATANMPSLRTSSILLNGILHGFSWDGAPSLAPALALMTWGHTITFLSSYAVGTTITMAFVTTLIGEGTRRASQIFQRPDLPQKFSYASSILAISIGVIWCGLGLR